MKIKRKCKLEFTNKSREDFANLPKELIEDCIEQLNKLENDIELGKRLHNQPGRDLSSCRKLYFAQATYRIVYRELENTKTILEIQVTPEPIAEIVAIGKRECMEVYEEAAFRLSDSAMTEDETSGNSNG